MLKKWLSIRKLPHHTGMYLRAYGNRRKHYLVKLNYDSQKFTYNNLVALGLEYYNIKKYFGKDTWNYSLRPDYCKKILALAKNAYINAQIITNIRKGYWFLNQDGIDSLVFYHASMNYHNAWNLYNKGTQHHVPTFHKRNRYDYFYNTSCVYHKTKEYHVGSVKLLTRNKVQIPKLGIFKTSKIPNRIWKMYKNHDIRIGSVKVRDDNLKHFYISMQLASDKPFKPLPKITNALSALGYDLNTSNFLACNDNKIGKQGFVANPRYYEKQENRMKKLQRALSRKYRSAKRRHKNILNCKNYQANRIQLAKVAKHVMNQRFNFLQNLSTKLIKSQDFLVGENLKSKNMLRNHRIAKSIQSVGWRAFISMLDYKAKMYHKIYILVNPANTTQMCDNCGYVCNKKDGTHLTLKDRTWTCPHCGMKHIRDINASKNILAKGLEKILPYLPKKYYTIYKHSTVRKATHGHQLGSQKVLVLSHKWLKYLVTHYYGVIDSSRLDEKELITQD